MNNPDAITEAKRLLRVEMDRQGMTDNELRAGTAAIALGESGFESRSETPYRNTSNDRIRLIFRSRLGNETDEFLDDLKASDERFFNHVYGPHFNRIHTLGQELEDDGWRYRGRGTVQLTGRANYTKLAELTGHDIVVDPDLANRPNVAAAITVAYMLWRYKGGGWAAMKSAVGISFGEVDGRKNAAFAEFTKTGEFNVQGSAISMPRSPLHEHHPTINNNNNVNAIIADIIRLPEPKRKLVQTRLKALGLYDSGIDGDIGPISKAGIVRFLTGV